MPLLEVEARKSDTNPSETLNLRIRSDIAYLGRYAVLAAAEVKNYEAQGKGDKEIISDVGTDLNIQEMEQVNTAEGYDIEVEFSIRAWSMSASSPYVRWRMWKFING